ncbi:murein transglycosylase A [Agaribacterium haliotis]|uniref:murein transglycosylase A n=1 Tax=Agaribacterium haliotis TaxID=2013869 RepID=UPI000BB5679C|nr:murein transglycosylase A [Agaribacterium haliotis]
MKRKLLCTLLILGLSGCTKPDSEDQNTDELQLSPVSFKQLPGWENDQQLEAYMALLKSCEKTSQKHSGAEQLQNSIQALRQLCQKLTKADTPAPSSEQAARAFFEQEFQPYLMRTQQGAKAQLTGYYEASLRGSYTKSAVYSVPIRKRPADLVLVDLGQFREQLKGQRIAGRVTQGKLQPYEDRQKIEQQINASEVLLWVDSAIDKFFLQIQGSGLVALDSGELVRIGYDGHNGHLYSAIGKTLIERGEITKEAMSMQAIRQWLKQHPAKANELMNTNRSYIFFRKLNSEGPIGAEGVSLSPGRSLAIDPRYSAYGLPIYIDAEHPLSSAQAKQRLQKLTIAQDTGGAIKGPLRGDFFWGHGEAAAEAAGKMNSSATMYLLLPKGSLAPNSRP